MPLHRVVPLLEDPPPPLAWIAPALVLALLGAVIAAVLFLASQVETLAALDHLAAHRVRF